MQPPGLASMKRPFPVTVVGWLFIVTGVASMAYHLRVGSIDRWTLLIAAVPALGIIGALYLMRGHGWARWLLLVWLAFHVVLSAFHSWSLMLAHLVLSVAIAYALLTPPASEYFRSPRSA
jgi:uncharacterized membrane protein HdeD (DUF308 family)